MRQLHTAIRFEELREGIGQKINHHLTGLDENKKNDSKKRLELCQIGKLIFSYFKEFEITNVLERPDFLISNGRVTVGLEHQLVLDAEPKSKEGFYENIFDKVESFRHIVNLNRIKGYNSVNLKMGYPILEIRTPQELVSYGD